MLAGHIITIISLLISSVLIIIFLATQEEEIQHSQ